MKLNFVEFEADVDQHVLGSGRILDCQTAARNGAMHLITSKQDKILAARCSRPKDRLLGFL